MKQQGTTWYTPDGKPTQSKYLPTHEKLFEKLAQKIAAEAEDLDKHMYATKKLFVDICKEALRNSPNKDLQRRFTFHTFDREYRIEFDIQEENVRVYRATKRNPSSKDYDFINLDMNTKNQQQAMLIIPSGTTVNISQDEENTTDEPEPLDQPELFEPNEIEQKN